MNDITGDLDVLPGAGRSRALTSELFEPVKPADQGVDSIVRGFVVDFQRLALEWQGA